VRAVVRQCASVEDRKEICNSKAVTRAVVKSDGDESEVMFTEQSDADGVRAINKTVSEPVTLYSTCLSFSRGRDEHELSEVHSTEGCRMEEAGL
ncbi:ankyrin-2, partial [Tachysurus ichikawai]